MPPPTNGAVPNGKMVAKATTSQGIIDITNKDRQLFQLWGEMTPAQLGGILKQAIVGNLVWQERLFQKMCDEWPRLQKNLLSLKRDVADLDWGIVAFTDKGNPATQSAQDKAELVERALFGMVGDPTMDESDWSQTIKDIVDAVPCGFAISEIYWTVRDGEIVPRCTRKIPARYYGYGLMPDKPDQLMLNPKGNLAFAWYDLAPFPENKFLVGVFKSYNNHPTMAAMLRSLTPWYFAHKFGLKWFMTFAQIFGTPMRIAHYTPGDQATFNSLCDMLEQMGYANWGVFPAGAEVELLESKTSNGTMLPQRVLTSDADEQCDIMILGQTLTSQVTTAGGSRALGQVHADTERKVLNGVADFVRTVINRQLIPAILMMNYGNVEECPTLEGTLEEPTDELALAQRDQILFSTMGLPVAKDFLYPRHSVPEPAQDAELFKPPMAGPDPAHGIPTMPAEQALMGGVKGPKPPSNKPDKPKAKAVWTPAQMVAPTMQMVLASRQGLALRKEHGFGGTTSAVIRARDIAQGNTITAGTAQRLMLYFDSHPEDATAAPDTSGGIAFLLHGGNAGKRWVEQIVKGNLKDENEPMFPG